MIKIGDKVKIKGSETWGVVKDIRAEYRNTNRYRVTVYYVEIDMSKQVMDFTHDELRKIC